MADESKSSLDKLADSYLEELHGRLIKQGVFLPETNDGPQKYAVVDQNSNGSDIKAQNILQELYNLRNIAQTAYLQIEKPAKPPTDVLKYLEYFNEKGITSLPLEDTSFSSLINNINSLTFEDISGRWLETLERHKINSRNDIGRILEFYTHFATIPIAHATGFSEVDQKERVGRPDILFCSSDKRNLILFEVKFREIINDLRSIVLREIEGAQKYFKDTEKVSLIILCYTNQQPHNFDRLITQFTKILVEHDEDLINSVFFIPISVFKIDDLSIKLLDIFQNLFKSFQLDFQYSDSPLKHGWEAGEGIETLQNIFIYQSDSKYGNVLQLNFPTAKGNHFIDYQLTVDRKYLFHNISFVVQPTLEGKFYVEISVKDDRKPFWFQIVPSDQQAYTVQEFSNTEYVIFYPITKDREWSLIDINIRKIFDQSYKTKGLVLNRVEGVRFRGKITIARITFS